MNSDSDTVKFRRAELLLDKQVGVPSRFSDYRNPVGSPLKLLVFQFHLNFRFFLCLQLTN